MTSERTLSRRSTLKYATTGVTSIGIAGLAGCSGSGNGNGSGGGDEITLASTYEPGHILVEAAESFAEEIEAETDGDIQVDVSAGGSYGAEDEIHDQIQSGVIEAASGGGVAYSMFAPEYYFYDSPFVIEDLDHLRRVADSDEFQEAYDRLREEGNQRMIGSFIYRGQRLTTSNEPISSPEDVQGLDIRLPELDTWVQTWEAIGVNATPVALDELYSSLQQGVAEASEGPAQQIHSFNLFEVQDHLSLTEHMVQAGGLYMSEDYFQGLDEAHQDAVLEIAEDVTLEASDQAVNEEEDLIGELEAEGMEVTEDVDQEAFREAAESGIQQIFEEQWAGTWDEWRNV